MKTLTILKIACLILLLGIAACFIFLPKTVVTEDCTNETEYKVVYIEKECVNDIVYVVEQCKNLTKEDYREYHDFVLEQRKEELASNPVKEVRPANYVSYCDRAGVVC